MQDPELAVLTADFKNHKEHEEKWQGDVDEHFRELHEDVKEIKEMLRPMQTQIQENTIVLYGVSPEKDNGINSDVKKLKTWRELVDGRWMKAVAIMFAIQLLFNAAGFILAKAGYFSADSKTKTEQVVPK